MRAMLEWLAGVGGQEPRTHHINRAWDTNLENPPASPSPIFTGG